MEITENYSMKDVLVNLKKADKPVDLTLTSGKILNGTISVVGQQNVVLKLKGNRSFFDAIVKLDDIAAVEYQARQ